MRPRCSILTGGFDFSGSGDFTSCPPVERIEMSSSEPSAIVLQGIPCMRGIIQVSIRMEKTVCPRFVAIHPFSIAHRTGGYPKLIHYKKLDRCRALCGRAAAETLRLSIGTRS